MSVEQSVYFSLKMVSGVCGSDVLDAFVDTIYSQKSRIHYVLFWFCGRFLVPISGSENSKTWETRILKKKNISRHFGIGQGKKKRFLLEPFLL
jgi:hypothetical protein